jgi:hypothetical protein
MRPARLAPAMISTLGHRVPRRRQRGAPPALAPHSARIDLIEEVGFATVSPPEGDDSNPRSPIYGELASRGARATRPTAPMIGFVTRGEGPNCGGRRDSLITAETSLIARFNSLQGRKKFPVRDA